MEDKTLLIEALGDSPTLRIIDFFLDNRSDYSKKEIIEATGMSKTTFYKIWGALKEFSVVKSTRKYGKAQLFSLDESNDVVKKLMALEFALGKQAMEKAVVENKIAIDAKKKQ